ncbi:ATP-binding protein [Streptomyces sp. NPDC093224]|uniref:sensor histidine kinase n=1 Tax=Streptomyces sp. NPDC093224 TaxID=3155198 RepID=UPI003413060A
MALQSLHIRRLRVPRKTTAVTSGRQRAQSFLIVATLLYRASHLAVGVLAVVRRPTDQPLPYVGIVLALALSGLTYGAALRRGRFDARHIWADVVVTGCVLPLALIAWGGVSTPPALGWAMLLGGSASAAAAIALDRLHAVAVVALLLLSHFIGYQAVGASSAVIAGHLNSLVSSALMTWVFRWYLLRQGSLLDEANARALAAEAHKARYAERLEHHRALHDTVLATLTTLAAGSVDANAPEVRARCAREAAYLRRLIQQTADEVQHREIGTALEEAVGSVEGLQLRVTAQYHRLPQVPPAVAAALGDAVREALNNVRRHAGTGHAYLTATADPDGRGGALVTVVDRGPGFDPENCTPGLGLRGSVHARMAEVGGRATVDSAPGEGVRVELRWPG